jgi:hypothetical protein
VTGAPGVRYYAIESVDEAMHYSGRSNVVQVEMPYRLYLPLVMCEG